MSNQPTEGRQRAGARPRRDDRLVRFLTPPRSLSSVGRYALAVAIVAAATALRWVLIPWLGIAAPYNIILVAQIVTTARLGLGPGLVCVVLGDVAVEAFVMRSLPTMFQGVTEARLGTSVAIGAFICWLLHALRAAHLQARKGEARVAALGTATFEGIVESQAGRILDCNEQFAQMVGCTAAELRGTAIADLVAAEDRERVLANIDENRESVTEHALLRKDGTRLIVEAHGRPLAEGGATRHTAVRDITKREEAEEARREGQAALQRSHDELEQHVLARTAELREAYHYARGLLEASLDPLVTISPEGKITDVNEATELVTGVARDRLIGSDFSGYFTEPKRAEAGYRRVIAQGEVRDYPLSIRHVAGHTTDVLYNATVYRDEAGREQGVFAAARDITERRRTETELARHREHLEELVAERTAQLQTANAQLRTEIAEREQAEQALEQARRQAERSATRLQALLEALPVGVSFSDDLTAQRITGNPALFAQFEVGSEENISASAPDEAAAGRQVCYLQAGRKLSDAELPLQRAIAENRIIPAMELEIALPSGRRWIAEASGAPVRDPSGNLVGGIAVTVDITARKQAEEERERLYAQLAQQARLLDTIVTATDSRLAYLDCDLRYVRVNAAYAANARMAPEEFVGRHRLEVFPNAPEVAALYQRVLDTGEPDSIAEHTGLPKYRPEVGPRTIRINAMPVKGERGEVEGIVTSMVDITDQVRQQQRLVEAERARAQLAETLGQEIAHRTKNNLAIVAGLLQLQLGRDVDASSHADLIRDAVARIMSFAALHEQMYQRHSDAVELLDALRRVAEVDRQALSVGEVTISVEGEPADYPSGIATNLCVVANELITNAIKHGGLQEGPCHVEVRLGRSDGRLALSVWNSGAPIAPDFDVGRGSRTGLDLVRTIVEDQYGGAFTLVPDRGGTLARILLEEGRLFRR